jgi:hypothetical protein
MFRLVITPEPLTRVRTGIARTFAPVGQRVRAACPLFPDQDIFDGQWPTHRAPDAAALQVPAHFYSCDFVLSHFMLDLHSHRSTTLDNDALQHQTAPNDPDDGSHHHRCL